MKHLLYMVLFMMVCFLILFGLSAYYPETLKNPYVFPVMMIVCMFGHFLMPHGNHETSGGESNNDHSSSSTHNH